MKISLAKHVVLSIVFLLLPVIAHSAQTIQHVYDEGGRLIRTQYGDGTTITKVIDYYYDEVGNRLQKGVGLSVISASPTSYDFGTVLISQSSTPATVTVSNTGNIDLFIGQLHITGTHASEFVLQNDTCSNQTIAQSASCTFDAVLSPTTEGSKTASIEIPSDDPNNPVLNIPLTGTGSLPVP